MVEIWVVRVKVHGGRVGLVLRVQIMMRNPKMASMHHYNSAQESQLEYIHHKMIQTQTAWVEMSHYECFCEQCSNLFY